jgi:hypothetical protein
LSLSSCEEHKFVNRPANVDQDANLDEESVDYRFKTNHSSNWATQMRFDSSNRLLRSSTSGGKGREASLSDPLLMQKLLQLAGELVQVDSSPANECGSPLYRSSSNRLYSTEKASIEYDVSKNALNSSTRANVAATADGSRPTLQQELESTSEHVKKHLEVTQQLHVQLQTSASELDELRLERKQLLKRLQSIEGAFFYFNC